MTVADRLKRQETLIQRCGFGLALSIYVVGAVMQLMSNRLAMKSFAANPLAISNVLLVALLVLVGALIWPLSKRVTHFLCFPPDGAIPAPPDPADPAAGPGKH